MKSVSITAVHHGSEDMNAAFRLAMRAFTTTVSLITTCTEDGQWRGMAATAVTSISMDPPTCLVCVNRETSLYPAVMTSQRFCINAMHQDHHELMWSFTNSAHRENRFQSGSWCSGDAGIPFLENAQANIFCEVFKNVLVGTHEVVFGRVLNVILRNDHNPLLYGQGAYLRQAER